MINAGGDYKELQILNLVPSLNTATVNSQINRDTYVYGPFPSLLATQPFFILT